MQTLRITLANNFSIPSGTVTKVPLDTIADGSLVSWWDAADNCITVPAGTLTTEGMIGFRCSIAAANPVGGPRRAAAVYRADQPIGWDIVGHHHFRSTGIQSADMISDTGAVTFLAGQSYSLWAFQESGVPLDVVKLAINTVLWVAI